MDAAVRRDRRARRAGFAEIVRVSRETLARLEAYADLLTRWQTRINLVGRDTLRRSLAAAYARFGAAAAADPAGARSLVDLGSGAGFPGLVLAILRRARRRIWSRPTRANAAFLREAARVTERDRDDPYRAGSRRCRRIPVDVVTARACAPLDRLLDLAAAVSRPRAPSACSSRASVPSEELTAARKDWTMIASRHPSIADPRGVVLRLQRWSRGRVSLTAVEAGRRRFGRTPRPHHRDRQSEGRGRQDHDRDQPRRPRLAARGRARAADRSRSAGQRLTGLGIAAAARARRPAMTCCSASSRLADGDRPTAVPRLSIVPASVDLSGAELELVDLRAPRVPAARRARSRVGALTTMC